MESTIITLAPSTASQVYDWLHRRVLRGELLPGARLSETEIAAKIGVSRQPVREAFIRLGSDGLAEIRPQRGTYISKISISAVLSARLIREAVEADLARLTAPDEVPAILQKGERVLSRREAAGYGQTNAPAVNVTIMARDSESFRQSRTQVASDIARAVSLGRRGM